MRVEGTGQTVMVELREIEICCAKVVGFVHGSSGHDSNKFIEKGIFFTYNLVQTLLELFASVIVELEPHVCHQLGQIFDLFGFGLRMASQNGSRGVELENLISHGDIGEQHKLFHHIIGLKGVVESHIRRIVSLLIEGKSHLCRRQCQRTISVAFIFEFLCDFEQDTQGICQF